MNQSIPLFDKPKALGSKLKAVAIQGWDIIRKPTTPVHWLFGFIAAFFIVAFGIWAGILAMVGFAAWERWNDKEILKCQEMCIANGHPLKYENWHGMYIPEGAMDFWESTVTFLIGLVLIGIFSAQRIVSVAWTHGIWT